jgi:hypothetical protein
MKNKLKGSLGSILALSLSVTPAFANEPGGGYEGITSMYYSVIGIILAYGVYDIFFKKS